MNILRYARLTNLTVTGGYTAFILYRRAKNFSVWSQILEERKDNSLLLPPPLKRLVDEVIEEMKLNEEDKSKIKFFFNETSDFVRFGPVDNQNGGILGIPHYFVVDESTPVKLSTMDKKKKISDIEDSHSLVEPLHLSYEAKKFAIARELYESLNSNHEIEYSLPLFLNITFLFFSHLAETISRKRMKNISYFLHLGLFLTGAIMSVLLHDLIVFYTETNADFLACDLGKSYINGGIEYYSKLIKKNKALKEIINNAPYSDDGDVKYSLFKRYHIPFQKRIIYLRDHIVNKEKPSIWNYILFPY